MFADFDPLDLEPGQSVSDWRIVRRIGSGAYAVVYEVEKDGQRFALKVACQTQRSLDPKQTDARARREAACLQQLNHRHVIRLWAQGRWPDTRSGFHYMVLDFVDGYTLERWVQRTSPTSHEAAVLFLKLFDALDHLHARGVFHRDLSLRNIMVSKEGEPVIIDFGAADYATAEELTDGPLPPGTPRNRSPEAHRFWEENRHNPSARYAFKATDDIFALGVNFYDVLTDPTPALGGTRPLLGNAVMEPPTPHRVTQGRVPAELSAYVMTLIHRDLEVRPATAKEARRPLEELVRFEGDGWGTSFRLVRAQLPPEPAEGLPPLPVQVAPADAAPAPPAPGAAARNSPRRAWLRPVFAGLLALAVLVAISATFFLHRPARPPAASPLAEKPTSRPTELASPLPTQQEAPPSVNQPDSPPVLTSRTPDPQQPQKPNRRRGLSQAQKCALLAFSFEWFGAGCSGVQTRPAPEPCPEEAIRAMEALGWELGSNDSPIIYMDVTKGDDDELGPHDDFAVFKDGPVTGAFAEPYKNTPEGVRVDGHLWTTGERIYGRYIRAHLPGGRTVPVCLELDDGGGELGRSKAPESKPGHTVARKVAAGRAVERWR
ncbi:MAG TPA: protein kinase [Myxococcaceae bacterium]|jgi:serine/threonine-protein kinase